MPLFIYGPLSTISPIVIPSIAYFTNLSTTNFPTATYDVTGTSTTYGTNYTVYAFTSTSTTYTVNYTVAASGSATNAVCYVLAVGGGGGGGSQAGSGGGGGGVVQLPIVVPIGTGSITIKVGEGGIGAPGGSTNTTGGTGLNSTLLFSQSGVSIGNVVAYGGGGAACESTPFGGNGGSGGGGADNAASSINIGYAIYNSVYNYGNNGSYGTIYGAYSATGGGGGGAGTPGFGGVNVSNISGGNGIKCNLPGIADFSIQSKKYPSGTPVYSLYWGGGGAGAISRNGAGPTTYYANGGLGGGGGSNVANTSGLTYTILGDIYGLNDASNGVVGATNTGGNGGINTGGGAGGSYNGQGGNGGSGIVIIAFPTSATKTPGFSPIYLPGGLLWLDAADTNVISTSGTSVTQWTDKSPVANHFVQSTAGNRPTTTTKTINSLNAIDFTANAGTSYMIDSSFNKPTDYSAFMVGYTASTAATTFMSDSGAFAIQGTATNAYLNLVDTGTGTLTSTSAVNTNSLIGVTSDGYGNFQGYYDASYIGFKSASGIVPKTGMWLGSSNTPSAYVNGYIGEVLFYNNNFSTPNRQIVEGYLANRWGLASTLPASHPFKSTTPSLSTVFNPAQVGGADGCLLWLDAGDITTFVSSTGNVTKWHDKSGKGYIFDGTNNPKIGTKTINGLNVLDTTTNSTSYLSNSTISVPANYTVFAVGYTTSSSGFGRLINGTTSSGMYLLFGRSNAVYNVSTATGGASFLSYTNTSSVVTTSPHLMNATINSSTGLLAYLDGTSVTVTNGTGPYSTAYTGLQIGQGSSQYWNGYICEILIYNSNLSDTQRLQVEGYLAWKWGIQSSLPSIHTYSTTNYSYFPFIMPY